MTPERGITPHIRGAKTSEHSQGKNLRTFVGRKPPHIRGTKADAHSWDKSRRTYARHRQVKKSREGDKKVPLPLLIFVFLAVRFFAFAAQLT